MLTIRPGAAPHTPTAIRLGAAPCTPTTIWPGAVPRTPITIRPGAAPRPPEQLNFDVKDEDTQVSSVLCSVANVDAKTDAGAKMSPDMKDRTAVESGL